jgi:hypothetical protein
VLERAGAIGLELCPSWSGELRIIPVIVDSHRVEKPLTVSG